MVFVICGMTIPSLLETKESCYIYNRVNYLFCSRAKKTRIDWRCTKCLYIAEVKKVW